MIAQWDSSLSVLPVARVQFPATAEYFKGFFPADRTLSTRPEPAWQKMAQSPLKNTTQPVDSEEEGRSSTMDRRWNKTKTKTTEVARKLCAASKCITAYADCPPLSPRITATQRPNSITVPAPQPLVT